VTRTNSRKSKQKGYVLLALLFAMTLMLIAMGAAAPRIAQQIRRQREEDLVHIGKDYATAIKRFVHKNGGRYPNSIEQLENTNHIRFLRKRYKDPTTGEDNWRLVHAGEAEIKIPAPNPGLNPSTNNPGLGGSSSSTTTANPPPNNTAGVLQGGLSGQAAPQGNAGGNLGSLQLSSAGGGQPQLGGGQIMGIASVNKAESIKEFNDKDHYNEWFFVYDLRLEQAGGTGVTVAAPRAGVSTDSGSSGQSNTPQAAPTGTPPATGQPPQNPQ
jgi:type II secretory pathway pseudopilin PulG